MIKRGSRALMDMNKEQSSSIRRGRVTNSIPTYISISGGKRNEYLFDEKLFANEKQIKFLLDNQHFFMKSMSGHIPGDFISPWIYFPIKDEIKTIEWDRAYVALLVQGYFIFILRGVTDQAKTDLDRNESINELEKYWREKDLPIPILKCKTTAFDNGDISYCIGTKTDGFSIKKRRNISERIQEGPWYKVTNKGRESMEPLINHQTEGGIRYIFYSRRDDTKEEKKRH